MKLKSPLNAGWQEQYVRLHLKDVKPGAPVTLKLLWGRVRSFEGVDNKDGIIDRAKTPYFYIGDDNPVGPKAWKVRVLMFVKPDYLVVFDRVFGDLPHRCNLHFTGDEIRRDGALIAARGRFDLDLLAYVRRPAEFLMESRFAAFLLLLSRFPRRRL